MYEYIKNNARGMMGRWGVFVGSLVGKSEMKGEM